MNESQFAILKNTIDKTRVYHSNEKPSEWYEANMVFPQGSAFPGPADYGRTPYWREIADCAAPDHPAKDITLMGPAQMGKSAMVLNPVVGHTIAVDPCNLLFLTGHTDLTKKAVAKIDGMISTCGITNKIMPNVIKARNNKTGDTALEKEFTGGILIAGSITNHNLMRQNDIKKSIADDLDAGQLSKASTGSTVDLITGRTKAYSGKCKRYWVSSPQIKGLSLIELQFEKSDKRYFFVDCPKCRKKIKLEFSIKVDDDNTAGLFWKLDNYGRVLPESVGYICQLCAGYFTDKNKYELLKSGIWKPTVTPQEHDHWGYHINGLYAAPGMTDWFALAQKYQLCNPPGQPRKEEEYQTFLNIDIGDLYEPPGSSIESKKLQANIQEYNIGELPEQLSIKHGNGRIVLLTCSADLGGYSKGLNKDYDDARLDYEVMAHTESGSTYSILHGSIGTFQPSHMGEQDEGRERWGYDIKNKNNVWKKFDEVLSAIYLTDTGRQMKISVTGIDTGFAEHLAFNYIESKVGQFNIFGLKGDKEYKYIPLIDNAPIYKIGQTRANLFILNVNKIKDRLNNKIALQWNKSRGESQPAGFLNFPQPGNKKYLPTGYFDHYEAEERKIDKNKNFRWQKKNATVQNHFWDCAVYNLGISTIAMHQVLKAYDYDITKATWQDFCDIIINGR